MTRIIDTPKALLVEVPEGSWYHELYQLGNKMNLVCFTAITEKGKVGFWESEYFPAYSYGQPILASKMREEDWKKVVEWFEDSDDSSYDPQYNETTYFSVIHNYETGDDDGCETFTESGQSLLGSHNLKPETTVVIPKN